MEDLKVKATIVAGFDSSQAKQQMGKFKDDIEGFKNRLSSGEGIKLASNLAELRLKLKDLRDALKLATTDQQRINIQTNIETVSKQVTQANRELTNFARTGDKTTSVLGNLFSKMKVGFMDIAKGIGVFKLLEIAIQAVQQKVQEGIKNALDFEGLESSFNRLNASIGESPTRMLEVLRTASKGTIADIDLVRSANKAMALGVGKDADQLGVLLEVAALKGKAFGLTTAEAFNDIVIGIGRGSPLILDNLGIMVKLEEEQTKYAKTLGKTSAQLTGAEKQQALLNSVLKEGGIELASVGEQALTSAEKRQKLQASIGNMFLTVGQYLVYFVVQFANWVQLLGYGFDGLSIAIARVAIQRKNDFDTLIAYLMGVGSSMLAIGSNIGEFFTSGLGTAIESGLNFVIQLVENALKKIGGGIDRASGFLSKIPGLSGIKTNLGSKSLGRVEFADKAQYKDVGKAYADTFNKNIGKGSQKTLQGLDLMLNEVDKKFEKAYTESMNMKVGGNVQTQFNTLQRGLAGAEEEAQKKSGKRKEDALEKAKKIITQEYDEQIIALSRTKEAREKNAQEILRLNEEKTKRIKELSQSEAERIVSDLQEVEKAQSENLKVGTKNAKEYIDKFSETIDKGKKSIESLTDKIKDLNKEIESLQEKQLSAQEKILSRYAELKEKMNAGGLNYDEYTKMAEEIKLIEENTTEAGRAESLRYNALSETAKLLEEIETLKAEQVAKEEQVAELEKQKALETEILTLFNEQRKALEMQYSLLVESESQKRMGVLLAEINRTKQLIKLQQQAGTSGGFSSGGVVQGNTNNTSNKTTQTLNVSIAGSNNPNAIVKEIKNQLINFNSGNNV